MNHPRVEAVARSIGNFIADEEVTEDFLTYGAEAVTAADAADREQGIHRVRVDDLKAALAGVYENRSSMVHDDWGNESEDIDRWYQEAILAALTGAGS